jgi:uncharacterized LabA/DUF88 family protein
MIVSAAAVRGVRLRRALSQGLLVGLALGVLVEVLIFLFPAIVRRGLAPDPTILVGALPVAGSAAALAAIVGGIIIWATQQAKLLPAGTGSALVIPNLVEVAISGGTVADPERNWGIFIDLSNVALGESNAVDLASGEMERALDYLERTHERILVRHAYGDFSGAMPGTSELGVELRRRGFTLAHMPRMARGNEKNHTDIQMSVDAALIARARPDVGGYIILSGDSDFTPLLVQLRTLGRRIHIVARERTTSNALIGQADAYIPLETIIGRATLAPTALRDAETTLRDALAALAAKKIATPALVLPHLLRALGIDITALGFIDVPTFQRVMVSLGIIGEQAAPDGALLIPGSVTPGQDMLDRLLQALGRSVADFDRRKQKPSLSQALEPIWKADPALDVTKTTQLARIQILHIAERLNIVQTEREHGTHELRLLPGKPLAA